MLLIKEQ